MESKLRDWATLNRIPNHPKSHWLSDLLRHPMIIASFSIVLSSGAIWNYQRKSLEAKEIATLRSQFVEDIQLLHGKTASYFRNLSALNERIKLRPVQYSKTELNAHVASSQTELNDLYERLGKLEIQANLYFTTNGPTHALHTYKLFIHSAINDGLGEAKRHGDVEPVLKKYLDSGSDYVSRVINSMGEESPFRTRLKKGWW